MGRDRDVGPRWGDRRLTSTSGGRGVPARGAGIAETPYRPVEEPGGCGQPAEHSFAGLGRRAIEYPGKEFSRSPQALPRPDRLDEPGPALRPQTRLDKRERLVLLVLHVSPQRR